MQSAPMRKPDAQKQAAVNIARRGPTRSTQVPVTAAAMPSITIAMEKISPTAVSDESKCLTRAVLYTLVAYAWPMLSWMASAAGGINQRLKPGPATVFSRSRKDSANRHLQVWASQGLTTGNRRCISHGYQR